MRTQAHRALIGLGSNLGDRDANIARALALLESEGDVAVIARSPLYTTAPVGGPPQGDFRNGAALVETALEPRALLDVLKSVERRLGREDGMPRWGPRTVDLDLLLFGERIVDEPGLVVPHPLLHRRRFVLEPAADVAPTMRHPVLDRTVGELLAGLLAELSAASPAGTPGTRP